MEFKVKEPLQNESVPPKSQDSVYYAKEKKQMDTQPFIPSGAGNGIFHLLQATKSIFSVCAYAGCMLCMLYMCVLCVYVSRVIYMCV